MMQFAKNDVGTVTKPKKQALLEKSRGIGFKKMQFRKKELESPFKREKQQQKKEVTIEKRFFFGIFFVCFLSFEFFVNYEEEN